MINVTDNFLSKILFYLLEKYCKKEFKIIQVGEKKFSVLDTPPEIIPYLQIPNHKIILTFIRNAYSEFDTDWRIHADNIIQGEKTSLASVLYINNLQDVTENGTAFWKHNKYGLSLPKDITNKDFDRLLLDDSNDLSKWKQTDFISNVPNRFLTYDSNYFHSKFPNKIEKGVRIVLVTFYKQLI